MASAYLPEAKTGANLFSILKKIVPRMDLPEDRDNLNSLIIDMRPDPNDPKPFLDFSHAYSVSQSAEMVMLVIQQMYLGDVNDQNIRTLATDATKELTDQIDTVIDQKLKRFNAINLKIIGVILLPMIAFVLMWVGSLLMSVMKAFVK